jgi:nicotinamidase-related amidase
MEIGLPVRYYRAVPSGRPQGLVEEKWALDPAKTALVALHCWNIGCPGGIPAPEQFWVFVGSQQNHVLMWQIVTEQIAPALAAARQVGMAVVHVQPEQIANRYRELQPPLPPAPAPGGGGPGPISDHAVRRAQRVHGEGYSEWEGWERLDAAEPARPQPGEMMIVTTEQLDAWLRSRGIDTLLYMGFCTNLCILDSPAAMRALAGLGYRCVILREATMAVEFPDTLEAMVHTQAALRYIEAWVGYSASVGDFLAGCRAAAGGEGVGEGRG